jgi:hypothetical protein
MPINLGNCILRRHQNHPANRFFGNPYLQDAFASEYGIATIKQVYDNLVAQKLVERIRLVSVRGNGVYPYNITEAGRAAVVGPDFDPD